MHTGQSADSLESRYVGLFNDIASHVQQLGTNGEPASKKRKLDSPSITVANGRPAPSAESVLLEIKEISVSVPQRKKFELCFTDHYIYARAPNTTAPIPAITYAWEVIEHAFYLPVPDKAQVQHNYILFPRGTCLSVTSGTPSTTEPFVFTVPATPPKPGTIGGSEAGSAAAVSDTYRSLFHWAIERRLKIAGNAVKIISSNPNKFQSAVRQPHRPNEKAVHVGGFRGSKDGYLFFLETGILWGFKKPLIFLPLERISAVSYTSVLQITFNIVVEVFSGENDEVTEELEFGMLDQQDFGGIDTYVKQNGLQDRSMAEQRKGKLQLAENRKKGEEADGDASELQTAHMEAEQQMQDDEDEDEEDYDPGADGESEGSGESSDEDDEDAEGEGEGDDEDADGDGEEEEEETVQVRGASRGFTSTAPDSMDMDQRFDVGQ